MYDYIYSDENVWNAIPMAVVRMKPSSLPFKIPLPLSPAPKDSTMRMGASGSVLRKS